MIARRNLPHEFQRWNREHSAPFGPTWWQNSRVKRALWAKRMKLPFPMTRAIGPFGFQANSSSRVFEYPWCYFCTPLTGGMRTVDIGAGASGFQFVLAADGLDVTSLDPLVETEGSRWTFPPSALKRLQKAFGVTVQFIPKYLHEAALPGDSYDRVFSISVMEHASTEIVALTSKEIGRILKPGGFFIATIDLFLDCYPFTQNPSNKFGSNISVRGLVEASGLELVQGDRSELYGYPEFDANAILRSAQETTQYLTGTSTNTLIQCLVLRK